MPKCPCAKSFFVDKPKIGTAPAGQISLTMNVIQQITTQTSSGSTATAESIGNLAKMASQLRRSVSGFTLPAAQAQATDNA